MGNCLTTTNLYLFGEMFTYLSQRYPAVHVHENVRAYIIRPQNMVSGLEFFFSFISNTMPCNGFKCVRCFVVSKGPNTPSMAWIICNDEEYQIHFFPLVPTHPILYTLSILFFLYYYYLASRLNAMRADKSVFVYVFHIITPCTFVCFSRYSLSSIYIFSVPFISISAAECKLWYWLPLFYFLFAFFYYFMPSNRFIEYQH